MHVNMCVCVCMHACVQNISVCFVDLFAISCSKCVRTSVCACVVCVRALCVCVRCVCAYLRMCLHECAPFATKGIKPQAL